MGANTLIHLPLDTLQRLKLDLSITSPMMWGIVVIFEWYSSMIRVVQFWLIERVIYSRSIKKSGRVNLLLTTPLYHETQGVF